MEYVTVKWLHILSLTLLFGTGIGSAFNLLFVQLRALAKVATRGNGPLPPQYWRYFKIWMALGFPAFFAFLAVFWLMVAKPS